MDTTVLLLLLFCVHLRCRATSAPDTDSASLLLLFLFCFVVLLDIILPEQSPAIRHFKVSAYDEVINLVVSIDGGL